MSMVWDVVFVFKQKTAYEMRISDWSSDVCSSDLVIGLIGERSREVADFLETKVAGAARQRSVVVAVPANHSPVLRIRGALRATAIAEAFRAEGKKVLLIMDSLTRVAHAGREIGLALGEPEIGRAHV